MKRVTICVLLYGDHIDLAKRCVGSIIERFPKESYELRVGMNECCDETLKYIKGIKEIDKIYKEKKNINKYPLMIKMFEDIETEFIWWFDDDVEVVLESALNKRIEIIDKMNKKVVLLGHSYFCKNLSQKSLDWVKKQPWYRGRPIPCGAMSYDKEYYKNTKKMRLHFPTGYSWFARTDFIKESGFPGEIVRAGDIFLGIAIRQMGYAYKDVSSLGLKEIPCVSRKRDTEGKEKKKNDI